MMSDIAVLPASEATIEFIDLSAFCGAKHVLSCANGTDALGLTLMARNLKRGQAVMVPSFTFAATAEVVAWFDARAGLCRCLRGQLQHWIR